jgi:hypothetical protein
LLHKIKKRNSILRFFHVVYLFALAELPIAFTKMNFYFYANRKLMNFLEKVNKWIGTITAFIACFVAYQTYFTKQKVENIEVQKSSLDFQKDSLNFRRDREFKFKIYDLVLDAIKSKDDTLKQKAATVIVSEMVSDEDKGFKLGLLNIINSTSTNPTAKEEAQVAIYNIEEAQKKLLPTESKQDERIRVDIFYAEWKATNTKATAITISNSLGAKYNTRVRLFPLSINNSAGYQITNNQVRCEKTEIEYQTDLIATLKSTLPNIRFEAKESVSVTPNYVSIFIVE